LVRFDYDKELIKIIKNIGKAKWSQTNKSWYFIKTDFDLPKLINVFRGKALIDVTAIDNKQIPKSKIKLKVSIPSSYYDMLDQKRYSHSTRATYTNYFEDFIRYFSGRSIDDITVDEINGYILKLIRKQSMSASQQNQRIN
jgi:hypothetical protein